MSWRVLAEQVFRHISQSTFDHVYMFGVYTGESVSDIINLFHNSYKYCKYYGFDSFIGLPKEEKEELGQEGWTEGAFNACEAFGSNDMHLVMKQLRQNVRNQTNLNELSLTLVPGFFSDSLNTNLVTTYNLQPAVYVDIDCDLYSSTIDCLEWLYSNRLIVPGTVIGYDDWGGTPGWETNADGESRAHYEMCEKYKVRAKKIVQVGNSYPHVHTMFFVENVEG
jgi:hypothetical protein